ncbi:MAG: addiction module toxin RelE [Chloroflexaceae bacterium]|nr:addiction module toxin RelE [Chloroflexaceae bacterium]
MEFIINVTPSAREDIRFFKAYEQRIIADGIRLFLTRDALVANNRRKLLDSNPIAPWELRIDNFRVFYDVEGTVVNIRAVGEKEHNDLYIRGVKVKL